MTFHIAPSNASDDAFCEALFNCFIYIANSRLFLIFCKSISQILIYFAIALFFFLIAFNLDFSPGLLLNCAILLAASFLLIIPVVLMLFFFAIFTPIQPMPVVVIALYFDP